MQNRHIGVSGFSFSVCFIQEKSAGIEHEFMLEESGR